MIVPAVQSFYHDMREETITVIVNSPVVTQHSTQWLKSVSLSQWEKERRTQRARLDGSGSPRPRHCISFGKLLAFSEWIFAQLKR